MLNQSSSCLIRIPFTVAPGALNGIEIARENFTGIPNGDSNASANHNDSVAILLQRIDIPSHLGLINEGQNLLAIHGLNSANNSSGFLISAELEVSEEPMINGGGISPTAIAYTGPIPISSATSVRARVFDDATWSALNEATFTQDIANLVVSEIMYHPIDPPQLKSRPDTMKAMTLNTSNSSTLAPTP